MSASYEPSPAAVADPRGSMRRRILIVDDDPSVRSALAELLTGEGYDVLTAPDGRTAYFRFRADPPDLVLLDLTLPQTDGWRVFDEMEHFRPFVPCIVITARPGQGELADEVGIDALLEKPLEVEELLTTIQHLFSESEYDRVARLARRALAAPARRFVRETAARRGGGPTA